MADVLYTDEADANPLARVTLRSGRWVSFEALLDCPLTFIASQAETTVDDLLEDAERWATGPGLMYGVRVDRDARTVTQVGRDRG